jgi:hypothetical protein
MTAHRISINCKGCFRTGEPFFCDVCGLFYQLHIPPQEQIILWNMAVKKMNCENFKNILLLLLQSKSVYGINLNQLYKLKLNSYE